MVLNIIDLNQTEEKYRQCMVRVISNLAIDFRTCLIEMVVSEQNPRGKKI
jgi:hypothetical protein